MKKMIAKVIVCLLVCVSTGYGLERFSVKSDLQERFDRNHDGYLDEREQGTYHEFQEVRALIKELGQMAQQANEKSKQFRNQAHELELQWEKEFEHWEQSDKKKKNSRTTDQEKNEEDENSKWQRKYREAREPRREAQRPKYNPSSRNRHQDDDDGDNNDDDRYIRISREKYEQFLLNNRRMRSERFEKPDQRRRESGDRESHEREFDMRQEMVHGEQMETRHRRELEEQEKKWGYSDRSKAVIKYPENRERTINDRSDNRSDKPNMDVLIDHITDLRKEITALRREVEHLRFRITRR